MNKKLILNIVAGVLLLAGVVSLVKYNKEQDVSPDYETQITKAAGLLKKDMDVFLRDAEKTIKKYNETIGQMPHDRLTKDNLDRLSNTVLSAQNSIKGVVIFSDRLNYVFLLNNDSRTTTYANGSDSLLNWVRLDKNLKPVSEWTDTYNFFLNSKNKALLKQFFDRPEKQTWMKIKSEINGRENLTVQLNKVAAADGHRLVVIYIFKTNDFSDYILNKLKKEDPLLTLLTVSGDVFTPIAYNDTIKERQLAQKEEKIKAVFNTWLKNYKGAESRTFSFELNNNIYWVRVDTIDNDLGLKAFALTFNENSLNQIFSMMDSLFLYGGLIAVFSAIALWIGMFVFGRKHKNKTQHDKPEPLSEEKIETLIKQGESGEVEYKSSLRYDYRLEKENKALEDVIIKSIAAFANGRGGVLIIGVDDEGNVLGLQKDFETLKKKDVDYFELHLRKLIKNQFGLHFSDNFLRIQFPEVEGQTIAVITIRSSEKPLYVKTKNKQGQWVEKFYVRLGNSSQEITSLKEIEEYIRHRFNNN